MSKPVARKPLPQFNSWQESVEFYSKYGDLKYKGMLDIGCRFYSLDTIDGRYLRLKFWDDGRVEELIIKPNS
jgi:hypothetical protein